MLGVGGRGTGIVQAREIESAVYKNLFWTSSRMSAPPILGGGILDGNSPLGEYTDPEPVSDIVLLTPSVSLVNLSVIPVAWRPPPPVFGVVLAGQFRDPTVFVGMIS